MWSIAPSFPAGGVGLGLLLLRVSVAAALFAHISFGDMAEWIQAATALLALAILSGFRTRLFAAICLAGAVFLSLNDSAPSFATLIALLDAASLALVGPGAFSVDARLLGRRTVFLPDPDAR